MKMFGVKMRTLFLLLGCPFQGTPSYKFGFRSSVQKRSPGKGIHEGLVPRNDVLISGFIRFSLAWTLPRIFFVPCLQIVRLGKGRLSKGREGCQAYLGKSTSFI